jgi:Cysteine-rich CPCC
MKKAYPCVCCGFLTISDAESGTFEICPVCYWEDDHVQFKDIDFEGGANEESLRKARQNFMKFGASSLKFLKNVRPPLPDEIP